MNSCRRSWVICSFSSINLANSSPTRGVTIVILRFFASLYGVQGVDTSALLERSPDLTAVRPLILGAAEGLAASKPMRGLVRAAARGDARSPAPITLPGGGRGPPETISSMTAQI